MRRTVLWSVLLFLSLAGRAFPAHAAMPDVVSDNPGDGLPLVRAASQGPDSLQLALLDAKLDEFFAALENEPVAVKNAEADFLIGSCAEGPLRDHVAVRIYDHYIRSKRMGDEGVAVHLADDWFSAGKANFFNETDAMNARIYAEFNRRSLIGNPAPEVEAKTPDGTPLSVPACSRGRAAVLYLYDTDCAKCKLETMLLRNAFAEEDFPIDFIAFYTGDDGEAWERYRTEQLGFGAPSVRMVHVWDPELDSDFLRLYGVLQTPRMFLVDKEGIIIGRGLDTPALMQMLRALHPRLEYGSEASFRLFDEVFGALEPAVSGKDVRTVGKRIGRMTLERGDTLQYKQLSGDLLAWLSGKRGEAYKEGTAWVADSLVFSRPELWNTQEDTLQVLGLADLMKELLSLTPVGSRIPDIEVPGTLVTARGARPVRMSLRRVGGSPSYVIFHTQGCHLCQAEKDAVAPLLEANPKARILEVDVDRIDAEEPELAERLLETFDLFALPFILETDRKGRVVRKYLTLQQ